jgi:uncharacterized protein (DUF1778 family)
MAKRAQKAEENRTHSDMIRVRTTPEVRELIERAAESAAKRRGTGTVSDWVRETLVAAARQELGEVA